MKTMKNICQLSDC